MKTTITPTRVQRLTIVMGALFLLCALGNHSLLSQPLPGDSLAVREARRDWLQADLTLDNSAYANTRKAIDKQVRSGVKPTTLVQQYRLKEKDAYDPSKIFRWAYAVYRQQKAQPNRNVLLGVSTVMDRNLRPGAYDWVRLRFLIASLVRIERGDALAPVGRRLLQQKYDDEEVMFHYVRALTLSEDKEDRRVALALAREQSRKFPKDVYWQWMVADATNLYLRYGGVITYEENNQILTEMNKTLRLLPADDPQRKRLIEAIVIYQMHYDANGEKQHHTADEINQAIADTKLR